MGRSIFLVCSLSRRTLKDSFRGLFFLTTTLTLMTSLFILFYISSTSKLVIHPQHTHLRLKPRLKSSTIAPPIIRISVENSTKSSVLDYPQPPKAGQPPPPLANDSEVPEVGLSRGAQMGSDGNFVNNKDVFHEKDIFLENYKEMNSSLKIYVYPHRKDDPFANVLLPTNSEPGGNYASESYFKKALMKSHFVSKDPTEADLFFLPFSIASLRHDKRVGVGGIQNFIRDYIFNISHRYPYWNRTGGTDHFYVACHSVGRTAMEKAAEVKLNAIQVVCSSSYFVPSYVAHKDASIPQIWPRHGNPPNQAPSKRKRLAFYAGAMNSKVRKDLVQAWRNDSDIAVHHSRLKTPYAEALLGSKFCIHAKGYEVNTARIGDALYYGCVPVILADHYDLPFADTLNWRSFSIIVATLDIRLLKKILTEIDFDGYLRLQKNVLKVQTHFQWHPIPIDYDAFYMVMYELWLRRSSTRLPLNTLLDYN